MNENNNVSLLLFCIIFMFELLSFLIVLIDSMLSMLSIVSIVSIFVESASIISLMEFEVKIFFFDEFSVNFVLLVI